MFVAISQSVLVDDETTLPVFSSMSTWELTFFTCVEHDASSSVNVKMFLSIFVIKETFNQFLPIVF